MRTCCPICGTVFRITPEQLRARAGKVRCGQCHSIFNALESLIEDAVPPPGANHPATQEIAPPEPKGGPGSLSVAPSEPQVEAEPETPVDHAPPTEPEPMATPAEAVAGTAAWQSEDDHSTEDAASIATGAPEITMAEHPSDESPEESTQAAREAGLVAARELAETPGYSRWAAGTLASNPLAGLVAEPPRKPVWPFVLAALLLLFALLAQLAYHFRTELGQRLPATLAAFDALEIAVPLPRIADLVSIEASDLQADNARGLLVLSATLKNRAPHPQSWPALELTLTDAQDAVVARRVLLAPDYLPPQADPGVFAASSETALRLWIEAKAVGAAGYRLYVFYP